MASCKEKALQDFNYGHNDPKQYEQDLSACNISGVQNPPKTTTQEPAPKKDGNGTTEAEMKAQIVANQPQPKKQKDSSAASTDNGFKVTALIVIALIATYFIGKKMWSKGVLWKVAIIVVAAIVGHDALHHFWPRGFIVSITEKLKI